MVQFSGQVVDNQGCSKKIGEKRCRTVQKWFPVIFALLVSLRFRCLGRWCKFNNILSVCLGRLVTGPW